MQKVDTTYKLRLYPNDKQEQCFFRYCGATRWVYNWGLQRWKQRYEEGLKTTAYDLANELVFIKKMDATKWLSELDSQAVRHPLNNLRNAFKKFFNKQAGYPQYKKKNVNESFCFPRVIKPNIAERYFTFQRVGQVKYRGTLPKDLDIKNVIISYAGGCWYACIQTTKELQQHPKSSIEVGLDAGVVHLMTSTDSTGRTQHWDHNVPRLDALVKAVDRCHEALSRKQRIDKVNSKNRNKALVRLRKAYAKLRNFRTNALHQLSHRLVRRYGTIIVEDLKIPNMTKSAVGTVEEPNMRSAAKRGLNRAIVKQAWGAFFRMLEYKCAWYGRTFLKVDPKHTSQSCPQCNHTHKDNRKSQAVFKCVACGYTNNADIVGAANILRRGLLATA